MPCQGNLGAFLLNIACRKVFDVVNDDEEYLIREYTVQPGLTGGSGDTYVRHMLTRVRKLGWRVVVFNSRGCGNSPVTSPQVNIPAHRLHPPTPHLEEKRKKEKIDRAEIEKIKG